MAIFEVYVMIGATAHSVLITQSKAKAISLAHKMQAEGKPAFWEQIQ